MAPFIVDRPSLDRLPYEICLEIFKYIHGNTRRQHHILADIASSHRALSDPALDVLWHTMGDLVPLLVLIPGVQIDRHPNEPFTTYRIVGPIEPAAWQRFDTYAKRVRVLEYERPSTLFFALFAELEQYRLGPLLPNLHQLIWDEELPPPVTELGQILLSFPTPTLRDVTVSARYIGDDEGDIPRVPEMAALAQAGFLPRLASNAPMVRRLTLSGSRWNPVGDDTFRAISSLTALSNLSINLNGVSVDSLSGWRGFLFLRSFTMDLTSIRIATAAMLTVSSVHLNNIWVNDPPPATVEDSRHFFASLRTFKDALATLSVRFDALTAPNIQRSTFAEIIKPLLEFHRMSLLQIVSRQWSDAILVTDKCLDDMAVAWPRTSLLVIRFSSPLLGLTVRGLITLAQKCPSLYTLRLDRIDFREDVGMVPLLKGDLRSLSFCPWILEVNGDAPVAEYFKIAQIIDRLYPNLRTFFDIPNVIVRFILGLQAARKDERMRMEVDMEDGSGDGESVSEG
ncbi:hypothetical protein JAAARDRAFT_211656 [Jaapia argillacea MUCL 33604]|uniref:F-box domain-containing protein n=1 Tax=Jaapia argillacea MUCL 33604 TaxID=933084 RepID=A0A067P6V6_9AGAM|nr:hypothetical protein JAAARDRAFT_211656 [Jaapia argillacea MUCL 33604]